MRKISCEAGMQGADKAKDGFGERRSRPRLTIARVEQDGRSISKSRNDVLGTEVVKRPLHANVFRERRSGADVFGRSSPSRENEREGEAETLVDEL